MQHLIPVLDAALEAGLSKRQWSAFVAILRQTLGYRKRTDDISARRLEQLTGIQRNHIWRAKHELETLGLVTSEPGRYGERLALTALLAALETSVTVQTEEAAESRVPHVPKSPRKPTKDSTASCPVLGEQRACFRREVRPKQATTSNNLTNVNHTLPSAPQCKADKPPKRQSPAGDDTVASSLPLPYPPNLSPQEKQRASAQLDGLHPEKARQVLRIWQLKIERGEVMKSRLGLLHALVRAAREDTLDTRLLDEQQTQKKRQVQWQQRESWIEQQTHASWLKQMAALQSLSVQEVQQMLRNEQAGGGYERVA